MYSLVKVDSDDEYNNRDSKKPKIQHKFETDLDKTDIDKNKATLLKKIKSKENGGKTESSYDPSLMNTQKRGEAQSYYLAEQ